MRGRFVGIGFWTSILAFVIIEGDALLDQSEIGHASILFMFGTACLAAAACIALFAIITVTGLAASAAFKEAPRQHQTPRSQDSPPTSLAAGRSRSRRKQQSRPIRREASESRKAPPRNVNR
jgi:hypothetical protein